MAIHRTKHRFSMISNEGAEDPSLSWGARGLLWYLLTKPDGWEINTAHLLQVSALDEKDSLNKLLKELEAAGYLAKELARRVEPLGPGEDAPNG